MADKRITREGRLYDTGRQKLYDAEGVVPLFASPQGKRILMLEARLLPQRQGVFVKDGKAVAPSVEDCQRYVDDLLRRAWVVRRWGRQRIEVVWKASGSATGGRHVALPPWSRSERVILHEVAHVLTERAHPHRAWHGPEFAATYLTLVRYQFGAEVAAALRASYRARRVKVAKLPAVRAT